MQPQVTGRGRQADPGSERARPAEEYVFPAGRGQEERAARRALEARYPGVIFEGWCSQITVDPSVRIHKGATIRQARDGTISLLGDSHIGACATISLESKSGERDSQKDIRIVNSTIGQGASVCGPGISITDKSTIADYSKVMQSSDIGTIEIRNSKIGSLVWCNTGGEHISILESETSQHIECSNGGHISIGGSIVTKVCAWDWASVQIRRCTSTAQVQGRGGDINVKERIIKEDLYAGPGASVS